MYACAYRTVILFLIIFIGFTVNNVNALESQQDATKFIEKVSRDALAVITAEGNSEVKEAKLTKLFINHVDTKWIAHFAIGKYWREANDTQRAKYLELHKKFLLNNYIPKFKEYNNQEIKILKSYGDEGNANEYMVETQIVSKKGGAVNVNYKVRKSEKGKFMIYDVIAEGVSLIATERADFASVLSRGGIDELIKMLGDKV